MQSWETHRESFRFGEEKTLFQHGCGASVCPYGKHGEASLCQITLKYSPKRISHMKGQAKNKTRGRKKVIRHHQNKNFQCFVPQRGKWICRNCITCFQGTGKLRSNLPIFDIGKSWTPPKKLHEWVLGERGSTAQWFGKKCKLKLQGVTSTYCNTKKLSWSCTPNDAWNSYYSL